MLSFAAYAKQPSFGLRELWADCHDGIALQRGGCTWSLMQLEHASRFPCEHGGNWRSGSQMASHVSLPVDVSG